MAVEHGVTRLCFSPNRVHSFDSLSSSWKTRHWLIQLSKVARSLAPAGTATTITLTCTTPATEMRLGWRRRFSTDLVLGTWRSNNLATKSISAYSALGAQTIPTVRLTKRHRLVRANSNQSAEFQFGDLLRGLAVWESPDSVQSVVSR